MMRFAHNSQFFHYPHYCYYYLIAIDIGILTTLFSNFFLKVFNNNVYTIIILLLLYCLHCIVLALKLRLNLYILSPYNGLLYRSLCVYICREFVTMYARVFINIFTRAQLDIAAAGVSVE